MNGRIDQQYTHGHIMVMAIALVSLVFSSLNVQAQNDRLVTDYDATTYDNISYPGIEPPPLSDRAIGVDERSLWRLLSDKKYDQLNIMIERFRGTYPDWEPPADLMDAKIRGEIKKAATVEDYDQIITLSKQSPSAFTCKDPDHMWTLGNALYAQEKREELFAHYKNMMEKCSDPDLRLVTLQRASTQLPYKKTLALIDIEMNKPHTAFEKKNIDQFRYDFFSGWFTDAWDRKAMNEAEEPVKFLQKPVIDRKDAKMASLLGWWELQLKNPALARNWFGLAHDWQPDPDTAYGLALALKGSQQINESKTIIEEWKTREPRMVTLFAAPTIQVKPVTRKRTVTEIALEKTVRKYNQGNYQASLAISQAALEKTTQKGRISLAQKKTIRSLKMFEAWSLYNLSRYHEAATQFKLLYQEQAEIDSARGLVLSSIKIHEYERTRALGAEDCGPLSFLSSTRIPTDQPAVQSEISDLYYLFYKNWIGEELDHKNFRSVELKVLRIADRLIELEDCEMASAAGWAYLEKGDHGSSLFWFERSMAWCPNVDNAYSLALIKQKMGDIEGAEKITEKWRQKSNNVTHNINQLHSELLLERARREYANQNYTQSLALARESAELNPSPEADNLIAWNKYQLGNVSEAAEDFEKLYRENPDQQSADGLFTTLTALGNEEDEMHMEELANELGGPLKDHVSDLHAIQYYHKDQFVLAENTRVNLLPELKNVDTAAVSLMPYARHRSGEEGLGQLDMIGAELAGRAFAGRNHFYASLDFMNLDSGSAANNAELGSNANRLFNTFTITPTEEESLLIEPHLSYRYEADVSPHFSIGTTPLGGELGGVLTGEIGVDWRHGPHGMNQYSLKLFRKNKQESILSISGIVDPVTGNKWGRVVETGIQGDMRYQFNDSWTLTTGGLYGKLDGASVADNNHFGFWTSLGYNIDRDSFKYLTVGPAYRFDHYDENRRFFTFGHGGYFSPDAFHRLSAEVNFQTEEARQFIIKGRAALGYQYTAEDNAFAFPLSNTGPILNGDDSDGVAFDTQLSAVYRVTPWIQIGGFLNITQSPDFDDLGGGLMLRINLFDRPAVFSMDLPERPWNE